MGLFTFTLTTCAVLLVLVSIKAVGKEGRMVVSRLGRMIGVRGPGLVLIIPFVESGKRISLAEQQMDLRSGQSQMSSGIPNGQLYYRVVDPMKALSEVSDYRSALSQLAIRILQESRKESPSEDQRFRRSHLEQSLKNRMNDTAIQWGIEVQRLDLSTIGS